jgi:hypothetical protein
MATAGIHDGSLPQDHEDQMQLGIRIITSAFQNKMHSLEQETRGLRLNNEEQRTNVSMLSKKNSSLEVELVENHQRSQQLAEENKELFKTVGSLRKQITRLEALKSAVLSSIQDDAAHEAELGDTKHLMSAEFLHGATPLTTRELGWGSQGQAHPHAVGQAPAIAYTGAMTGVSSPGAPPPNPMALTVGGSNSPVIDGKQFFRQARSRLSYEDFNLFLASIKRLNNQTQSREATLEEARRIFGSQHQDLYGDFDALLNRHGM